MFRRYPKKKGKTFKYHCYTSRYWRRAYKSFRYEMIRIRKSTANMYVKEMQKTTNENELEYLGTLLYNLSSPKQRHGYLD